MKIHLSQITDEMVTAAARSLRDSGAMDEGCAESLDHLIAKRALQAAFIAGYGLPDDVMARIRKGFESTFEGWNANLSRDESGRYVDAHVHYQWEGWLYGHEWERTACV